MGLSDLHDDLLRRILYFAPTKEAACTSVLARRWRYLWPASGAINLDSSSYPSCGSFLNGAELALAAGHAHAPVRRLTFHVEGQTKRRTTICQVIAAVLANPAARRVEELRLTASHDLVPNLSIRYFQPFGSLRVLDLDVGMSDLRSPPIPAELAFPRLQAMRLRRCVLWAKDLQAMIDAAPLLATLHLHGLQLVVPYKPVIRCPRVTTLVLADLSWPESSWRGAMELDAPMLRSFRYRGFIRPFSLKPPAAAEITKVDLHFVGDNEHHQGHDERCQLFWQFVNNFSSAKILKLRLVHLEHIIVADKRKTAELLGGTVFTNLHRLDLQAFYRPGRRAGGVAFATFLRCCPVIRVLGLELSTVDGDPSRSASHVQDILDEEGKLGLCKSVNQFIRPRIKTGDFLGWRK